MTDNELLLALSSMFDKKLAPLERRLDKIEARLDSLESRVSSIEAMLTNEVLPRLKNLEQTVEQDILPRLKRAELDRENTIIPRLQTIESCYLTTYKRYIREVDRLDGVRNDLDIVKVVVTEHSEKLQQIS